jgi:hypothetical protein
MIDSERTDRVTAAAIAAARLVGAKSAREAAEITMGWRLSDAEWSKQFKERWERNWDRLAAA